MPMTRKLWFSFLVASLIAGILPARQVQQTRQSDPSPDGHLVRIRTGSYAGMCIGYCDHETVIEPGSMRSISRAFSEKKKYPEMKMKSSIIKGDWDDLKSFLDAKVLAAFSGRIGCPGCADEMVEWVEVEFSDGTKKSVSYNLGNGPPPIAALLQKIRGIGAKPTP
jgi:hypothetical protein